MSKDGEIDKKIAVIYDIGGKQVNADTPLKVERGDGEEGDIRIISRLEMIIIQDELTSAVTRYDEWLRVNGAHDPVAGPLVKQKQAMTGMTLDHINQIIEVQGSG